MCVCIYITWIHFHQHLIAQTWNSHSLPSRDRPRIHFYQRHVIDQTTPHHIIITDHNKGILAQKLQGFSQPDIQHRKLSLDNLSECPTSHVLLLVSLVLFIVTFRIQGSSQCFRHVTFPFRCTMQPTKTQHVSQRQL